MGVTQILFWFLSALAVLSAIMVVVSKNPVYSILYLIIVFCAISGHYILLNAQFIAIVNIIVYAGAIMVLFLFVVMLMNLNSETEPPHKSKYLMYGGAIAGGSLLVVLVAALKQTAGAVEFKTGNIGLIENLGKTLFTDFVFPFEISSVLFLSAMIGAVITSIKEKKA